MPYLSGMSLPRFYPENEDLTSLNENRQCTESKWSAVVVVVVVVVVVSNCSLHVGRICDATKNYPKSEFISWQKKRETVKFFKSGFRHDPTRDFCFIGRFVPLL